MENLIEIESFLKEQLIKTIKNDSKEVIDHKLGYGDVVWDNICVTYFSREVTEALEDHIESFKRSHGENEEMWYDRFTEEMIYTGMATAMAICIKDYIEKATDNFKGLVILGLNSPDGGFFEDGFYKIKNIYYNTNTDECHVNVISLKDGTTEKWDVNECFSSFNDFMRYV